MSKRRPPFARIAITLPQETLKLADRLARDHDRSRSWVISEAVRQYAAGAVHPAGRVREPSPQLYTAAAEVADARLRHLQADLKLAPAERLRRAQELIRLARMVHPRPCRVQVIGFDSLEDFAEWKKARRAAG